MARQSQSLQELARLANVGGDIRFQKHREGQRKSAERELSKRTDEAQRLSEKKMKGGWLLDALKFGAGFAGPIAGKAIGAGLNLVDILATAHATKKWEKQFDKSIPKHLRGTAYADYLKQNLSGLQDQLSQSLGSRRKANLYQELLSGGMKLGSMPVFGGAGAKTMPSIMPSGEQALDPEGIPLDFLGGSSSKAAEKLSFLDKFLPKDEALSETLTQTIPGYGLARAGMDANLFQYGELGLPLIQSLMRGKQQATSPAAPRYQTPSIRRRIM